MKDMVIAKLFAIICCVAVVFMMFNGAIGNMAIAAELTLIGVGFAAFYVITEKLLKWGEEA